MMRQTVYFFGGEICEVTTNQQQRLAREIMGKNFFGIEEAVKHFGVSPSRKQLDYLAEIPWSEEVLEFHKDTHILVAVFPMSILDIGVNARKLFYPHKDPWYKKRAFAKHKGEASWRLVRKTPIPNSTLKTWDAQQALLSKDEETPSAQIMVYMIIGHFLATGERLFENICVHTSSAISSNYNTILHRILVGKFNQKGLFASASWDTNHYDFGVSSARKFPFPRQW